MSNSQRAVAPNHCCHISQNFQCVVCRSNANTAFKPLKSQAHISIHSLRNEQTKIRSLLQHFSLFEFLKSRMCSLSVAIFGATELNTFESCVGPSAKLNVVLNSYISTLHKRKRENYLILKLFFNYLKKFTLFIYTLNSNTKYILKNYRNLLKII